MRLKNISLFLIVICLILLLCACNPMIRGVAIETYPYKLIYVISVDEELDLDGGTVYFLFLRNRDIRHYRQFGMIEMSSDRVRVTHNIDFTEAGVYTVEIHRHGRPATFEIRVVTQEEYYEIIKSERE